MYLKILENPWFFWFLSFSTKKSLRIDFRFNYNSFSLSNIRWVKFNILHVPYEFEYMLVLYIAVIWGFIFDGNMFYSVNEYRDVGEISEMSRIRSTTERLKDRLKKSFGPL